MKFYHTLENTQAELAELKLSCPEGFRLKAHAYRANSADLLKKALEQDSWAEEVLARKYELLAELAEHQGLHEFVVLIDLKENKLLDIAPVDVPNGYSGKFEERWDVRHLRSDRWYVPYKSKRVNTLSRYGYREAWIILPASVGTHSLAQTKHFSSSSLHIYKIRDDVLDSLGLQAGLIERYKHKFGTFFTEKEQENVFKRYLSENEQHEALASIPPLLVEQHQSASLALG